MKIPAGSLVYLDAQAIIYSVERHPRYWPILSLVWADIAVGRINAVTSELTLLEVLVRPLRDHDLKVQDDYERVFDDAVRLVPITRQVLRSAANSRALVASIRTPDAIHAATAQDVGADLLITNDQAFRRVPHLTTLLLDDCVSP